MIYKSQEWYTGNVMVPESTAVMVDSLTLLLRRGGQHPPMAILHYNIYALLTTWVVYHHTFFAHQRLWEQIVEGVTRSRWVLTHKLPPHQPTCAMTA